MSEYVPNIKELSREGVIIYFENWIGLLQEEIAKFLVLLYKEQIDFLTKAVEELKK